MGCLCTYLYSLFEYYEHNGLQVSPQQDNYIAPQLSKICVPVFYCKFKL